MPKISSFQGIVIRMHYLDHNPPHFHAIYGEYEGIIDIERVELIAGDLPSRIFNLVADWVSLHQLELNDNWERARQKQSLLLIDPLD
jgi:hypothetical protein